MKPPMKPPGKPPSVTANDFRGMSEHDVKQAFLCGEIPKRVFEEADAMAVDPKARSPIPTGSNLAGSFPSYKDVHVEELRTWNAPSDPKYKYYRDPRP